MAVVAAAFAERQLGSWDCNLEQKKAGPEKEVCVCLYVCCVLQGASNNFSFIGVPLFTGEVSSPLQRLERVGRAMAWVKNSLVVPLALHVPEIIQVSGGRIFLACVGFFLLCGVLPCLGFVVCAGDSAAAERMSQRENGSRDPRARAAACRRFVTAAPLCRHACRQAAPTILRRQRACAPAAAVAAGAGLAPPPTHSHTPTHTDHAQAPCSILQGHPACTAAQDHHRLFQHEGTRGLLVPGWVQGKRCRGSSLLTLVVVWCVSAMPASCARQRFLESSQHHQQRC